MSLKGSWEGKLIDATGATALVELNLDDKKGRLSGDFNIRFLADDADCGGVVRRLAQSGPVKGRVNARTGAVTLDYEVSIGLEPVNVRFTGKQSETHGHAKLAIVGCYETKTKDAGLTLKGGGSVLWRYAGR